eukprot:PhM_4_TR8483/c1_g1_i1/m.73879
MGNDDDIDDRGYLVAFLESHGVVLPLQMEKSCPIGDLRATARKYPESVPVAHDVERVEGGNGGGGGGGETLPCALCTNVIETHGRSYVQCRTCWMSMHCHCAKLLTRKRWPRQRSHATTLRVHALDVMSQTVKIAVLVTTRRAMEPYVVHSGQRVRCDRGALQGRCGTIMGVGEDDGRLYWHADGDSGATPLHGTLIADVMKTHSLHIIGSCVVRDDAAASSSGDSSRRLRCGTHERLFEGGEEWRMRPYGGLCPRCKQRFTELSRCDACTLWYFEGVAYDAEDWHDLMDGNPFRLYIATHAGARTSVHSAVETDDLDDVRTMLSVGTASNGYDVDGVRSAELRDTTRQRPIHIAVMRHLTLLGTAWGTVPSRLEEDAQVRMLRCLVEEYSADVHARDSDGNTALHYACLYPPKYSARPRFLVIRYLAVSGRADTGARNGVGCVPLDLFLTVAHVYDREAVLEVVSMLR